jgi:hypothetical protein
MKSNARVKNEKPKAIFGDPTSQNVENSSTDVTAEDRDPGIANKDLTRPSAINRKDNETKSSYSKL